jgi:hypothetical protein
MELASERSLPCLLQLIRSLLTQESRKNLVAGSQMLSLNMARVDPTSRFRCLRYHLSHAWRGMSWTLAFHGAVSFHLGQAITEDLDHDVCSGETHGVRGET